MGIYDVYLKNVSFIIGYDLFFFGNEIIIFVGLVCVRIVNRIIKKIVFYILDYLWNEMVIIEDSYYIVFYIIRLMNDWYYDK